MYGGIRSGQRYGDPEKKMCRGGGRNAGTEGRGVRVSGKLNGNERKETPTYPLAPGQECGQEMLGTQDIMSSGMKL